MTQGRSNAYWAANRYADPEHEPSPTAPLKDLSAAAAARFQAARGGLLALDGVSEAVRYMGIPWRWAWEYANGNRKLCWMHVVKDALSATITLSDPEHERLRRIERVPAVVARAVEQAQRTGPVRWCWLPLDDRRAVEAFLRLAGWKAAWIAERPGPQRAPQLRGRRAPGELEDAE